MRNDAWLSRWASVDFAAFPAEEERTLCGEGKRGEEGVELEAMGDTGVAYITPPKSLGPPLDSASKISWRNK